MRMGSCAVCDQPFPVYGCGGRRMYCSDVCKRKDASTRKAECYRGIGLCAFCRDLFPMPLVQFERAEAGLPVFCCEEHRRLYLSSRLSALAISAERDGAGRFRAEAVAA